ncbi:hypothetical protein KJ836_01415, partial [Patescibacteria group bacterium]|nr:hypothetical protein [Patescibacteria group bacterium]
MFGKNPKNVNNPRPKRFSYKKTWLSGIKIPRWQLGLGIAGAIFMLAVVLFSTQIGDLLSLFGLRAAGPNFELTVEPPSQTIPFGSNQAVYDVTITPMDDGIEGEVFLGVDISSPWVVSAEFDINPLVFTEDDQNSKTSHLTITTVLPGPLTEVTIHFTVRASGALTAPGGSVIIMLIKTVNTTLIIDRPPAPDFSIKVEPKTKEVFSGEPAGYVVTLESLNGFSGDVMLTSPDLTGYLGIYLESFNFLTNPITLSAGEIETTDLNIVTLSGLTETFICNFIVIGNEVVPTPPGLQHQDYAQLTINPVPPPQDYAITVKNTPQTVAPNGTAVYPIEIIRLNGFADPINLTTDLVLPHLNLDQIEFSTTVVNLGDPDPTITLHAKPITLDATIPFIVYGKVDDLNGAGPAERQSSGMLYIVNAPDYTIEVTPPAQSVFAGDIATYTVTIKPVNGFNEPVQLTDDVLLNFSTYVESVSYDANPITTSTLMHIQTKPGVTHPGFDFIVTGHSIPSDIVRFDQANLAIGVYPDYSLDITPLSRTVSPGGSANYTITLTRIGGFTADVVLETDLETQPGVESAIFNPVILSGGTLVSILTVTARNPAISADYPFIVNGNTVDLMGVPAARSAPEAHFIIQNAADFYITIEEPKSQTVPPGGAATYHIILTRLNGYRETVSLTHDLVSPFVSSAIFDDPIMPDGDNDAYLMVTATDPANDSTLPFIVNGNGLVNGILTDRQDNATFIIQNIGDYQIS